MTFEELKNEVYSAMENKPNNWRKGQFVFNYIDDIYGVARYVQFKKGVDCFYNDSKIDEFLNASLTIINELSNKYE